ncbi:uncharacterized protein [Arachis hypogaea]|uniref:uncharacterized protein isoform X2 n=1 Tax=Arachis hypogaea TaxID=3818 RepID=UPI003B20F5EB
MNDKLHVLLQGQERMQRGILELTTALTEVVNIIASRHLSTRSTPMATCGESKEERSMKETLETSVDNEEHGFVLEQVEEAMIVVEEEVVEDLGDAEPPWESRTVKDSAEKFEIDAKEDSAQPPKHIPCEKLDGTDQEIDSIGSDDHESSSPSYELASATELHESEEPYPSEYEDDVEVDFSQPPTYDLSDEEDIEDFDQDAVAVEKFCKEMEEFTEEYKGVELTEPLETPIPRPLPPNTSFKWVQSLTFIFTFPLEYGLLETDGQLRALCSFKSKREIARTQSWCTRFNKVLHFNSKCKDWYQVQLNGSQEAFGHLGANTISKPSGWKNIDQAKGRFKSKVWDPGKYSDIHHPGSLRICLKLLKSFTCLVWDPGGCWHSKH